MKKLQQHQGIHNSNVHERSFRAFISDFQSVHENVGRCSFRGNSRGKFKGTPKIYNGAFCEHS